MEPLTGTASAVDFDTPASATLLDALDTAARRYGDRALVYVDPDTGVETQHDYATLAADTQRAADALAARGVGAHDVIAFVLVDSRAFLTLFWACLHLRAIPAPLAPPMTADDTGLDIEKIRNVLALTGGRLLSDSRSDKCYAAMRRVADATGCELLLADEVLTDARVNPPAGVERVRPTAGDVAVLQFSSGSSGMPKGVALTHANLLCNTAAMLARTRSGDTDVMFNWMPFYHDFGLFWGHIAALRAGMKQVKMDPNHFARRPLLWLERVTAHRATLTTTTPTGLEHALRYLDLKFSRGALANVDLTCVRQIAIGAEMVRAAVCREFQTKLAPYGLRPNAFLVGYGLTETTVCATTSEPGAGVATIVLDRRRLVADGEVASIDATHADAAEFALIGQPVADCALRIVDGDDRELRDGRLGVIQIRGGNVATGYHRNDEAASNAFRDGWFDTGDAGFRLADGNYVITGRNKEMIVVGGRKHFPHDIEQLARRAVPDADDVFKFLGVAGYFHPGSGRDETALFYVPGRVDADRLVAALAAISRAVYDGAGFALTHLVPIVTRDVARTSSGKLMRRVLAQRLVAGELAPQTTTPARAEPVAIEPLVRGLWASVLGVDAATLHDDASLFDLGGNSIKAGLLQAQIEERLGLKLPPQFAYLHPSFGAQVKYLASRNLDLVEPATETEVILRTIVHDVGGGVPETIGATTPLAELLPGFAQRLKLIDEIARVFDLASLPREALAGETIRALGEVVSRALRLGEATAQHESFALMNFQETLYFHRRGFVRNEPSGLSCFICIQLLLDGDIDAERLRAAFDQVIARHPLLRAVIDEAGDRPRMRVLEHVPPFELALEDLRDLDAAAQDERLGALGRDLNDVRFDIGQWPMFIANLYRLDDARYALHFNIDHLLVDGYSFMVMLEEVLTAYGRGAVAKTGGLSFRDYALVENARQRTASYARAMEFQLGVFRNLPPKAGLPCLRDPANLPSVSFDTYYHRLDAALVERLIVLGGRRQVGLNSLLMAAWFKLVNLWSRQDDLIINMPVFNREQYFAQARAVMGSFIDIFPVRVATRPDESVLAIAGKIETFTRELLSRPVSSIDLSRRIAERDGLAAASMSSLIFSNSIGVYASDLGRRTPAVRAPEFRTGAPGTYLDLVMYDYEGEYYFNWNYVRELYPASFVETLAEQYQRVLATLSQLVGDLDAAAAAPFDRDDVLLPHHRAQIEALRHRPTPYPNLTLHGAIAQRVAAQPDAPALCWNDATMSYRELERAASRVAAFLQQRGVVPNDFVAVMFERGPQMIVAQLGVLMAGAAYVPVDPEYPPERLAYVVDDCGARVLVTQAALVERLPMAKPAALAHVLVVDADTPAPLPWPAALSGSTDLVDGPVASAAGVDDLAYMIYTSGSTGRPKGVRIRHRNILNFLHWVHTYHALDASDRVAFVTSYAFDMTLATNWTPLMAGASLHILDEARTRDVETLLRFLSDRAITFLNVTPSHFSLIANARAHLFAPDALPMPPNLRVMLGGETINTKDLNLWLEIYPTHRFVNEYGPTETSVASSYFAIPVNAQGRIDLPVVPIGKQLDNNALYILDTDGRPCLPGVAGELCIGGDGVADGYHNQPEKTAAAFVPDPFRPGSTMYRTGDLARLLDDGNIEFLGRNDHQINLRGYRIEAGEVEAALREHPAIAQAVVVARDDAQRLRHLVAFVVAHSAMPEPAELRRFLAAKLPAHMVPGIVHALDALPRSPSGKLDYRALPAVSFDGGTRRRLAPPCGETERRLFELYADVLGHRQIDRDDSFWDIGGDSLKAMRLVIRGREIGIEGFGLRELFAAPSIAAAAVALRRGTPTHDEALVTAMRRPARPRARLVLCPYACGNATAFAALARYLPDDLELVAVNPAWIGAQRVPSIDDLARAVDEALATLPQRPTFVAGYSFGGALAFALARRAEDDGRGLDGVVLAATAPPGVTGEIDWLVAASDAEILAYTRNVYDFDPADLGSLPLDDYLSLLRLQTQSMREFRYGEAKLATPSLVLVGRDEEDREVLEQQHRWCDVLADATIERLPGRHMLIKTHPEALAARVARFIDMALRERVTADGLSA
jgi:polyketide synthase PksJ